MLKNERTGKSGKFLCALLAAAIALTMLITPQAGAMESDAESTASGNVDYKTILGDAVNFGVTTEDFQLRGAETPRRMSPLLKVFALPRPEMISPIKKNRLSYWLISILFLD